MNFVFSSITQRRGFGLKVLHLLATGVRMKRPWRGRRRVLSVLRLAPLFPIWYMDPVSREILFCT